jgi:hypothetical protein
MYAFNEPKLSERAKQQDPLGILNILAEVLGSKLLGQSSEAFVSRTLR